jgi:choline dehydrogenase-like flavoprotein
MKVAVVGSGPSGAAAAATLLEQGHAVDVLDVGNVPDAASGALAAQVRAAVARGERPDRGLYRALRAGSDAAALSAWAGLRTLLGSVEATRSHKRILGSTFVWDGAEEGVPLERGTVMRSLARGGLSNAWGAACYPWRASDFAGWPIGPADLEPHYARAAEWLGLDQPKDALERAYPLFGAHAVDGARNPGSTVERLLERWREHDAELARAGLTPGRARLAVRPAGIGEGACTRCGLCFYGCAFGSIWHAGRLLATLEREDGLRYRPGHFVLGFAEEAGGVRVHGRAGGAPFAERYDALVLGAGVLSSLRIAADALGLHGREAPLVDNELYLTPFLALGSHASAGFRTAFTLGEAVLALEAGVVSRLPLHLQFYSFHEFFLAELGDLLRALPAALQTAAWAALNRLVIGFVYLAGEESSQATACVTPGAGGGPGRVRLAVRPRAESRAILRAALRHVSRLRRPLGLWPVPGLVKSTPFGFGGHLSGALPMRASPGPLETDPRGRLAGTQRVFVVDSAVFPTLPAQNLTFTVMANARRIAGGIGESVRG